jgi:hypothetical protein
MAENQPSKAEIVLINSVSGALEGGVLIHRELVNEIGTANLAANAPQYVWNVFHKTMLDHEIAPKASLGAPMAKPRPADAPTHFLQAMIDQALKARLFDHKFLIDTIGLQALVKVFPHQLFKAFHAALASHDMAPVIDKEPPAEEGEDDDVDEGWKDLADDEGD